MKFEHAIVGCLVEHNGKFLIVQESKPGRKGLWNLPSGHVDDDETLAQAAIRETREESGYEVELTSFIGVYQTVYRDLKLNVSGPVFLGKVVGGKLTKSAPHPDVKWVTADELLAMCERGEFWTKYPPILLKDYQRRGAYPLDTVSSGVY